MLRKIAGLLVLGIGTMLVGNVTGQEFQEVPPEPGYLPGPVGHPHCEYKIPLTSSCEELPFPIILPGFLDSNSSILGYLSVSVPLPWWAWGFDFILDGDYLKPSHQTIAFRGFEEVQGSITGTPNDFLGVGGTR
jgi:hypothetical protein